MKKLGAVALVAVGLIVMAQALPFLSGLGFSITMFANGEPVLGAVQLLWSLIVFAAMISAGIYLIRKRDELTDRWFTDSDIPAALNEQGVLRVALATIGIYLVATAVPDFVGAAAGYAAARVSEMSLGLDAASSVQDMGALVSQAATSALTGVVGIYLIAANARLATRVWNPRSTASVPPKEVMKPMRCESCDAPYDPDDYGDLANARCVSCHEPLQPRDGRIE